MIDFTSIEHLKNGNERQIAAYDSIQKLGLLKKLKPFDPILVGTIPIQVDIEESDLDIICYVTDDAHFKQVTEEFAAYKDFCSKEVFINEVKSIIVNFNSGGFKFEIFGQRVPSKQQNAFRHMVIEHQILQEHGEEFRREVINLKMEGYKTEPAFAKLLGLKGNPYVAMLEVVSQVTLNSASIKGL
ncbi:MAG: DUF4269 domain-containing protein [Sphingobacteriales bacterium]|nr:MAG: DUF4269 domain-containing protein [Sphingobacteriales bacterium]